jgi:hypothetical protein
MKVCVGTKPCYTDTVAAAIRSTDVERLMDIANQVYEDI